MDGRRFDTLTIRYARRAVLPALLLTLGLPVAAMATTEADRRRKQRRRIKRRSRRTDRRSVASCHRVTPTDWSTQCQAAWSYCCADAPRGIDPGDPFCTCLAAFDCGRCVSELCDNGKPGCTKVEPLSAAQTNSSTSVS